MKALWMIVIIVLPFLGTLAYLIVNSRGMAERSTQQAQASRAQFDEYVQTVAAKSGSTGGAASEIEKAKALLDSGAITQSEFDALKAKALA